MLRALNIVLVLSIIPLIVGCDSSTATPAPTSTSSSSPIEKPESTVAESPVSTPEASVPSASPIPTPKEGTGSVVGCLVDRETGETIRGVAVYLADVGDLIMIQQDSSPHVMPDPEGCFALLNVKPKTYAMVLWTPHSSRVVEIPEGSTYTLVVKPSEINDLGDLRVKRP